MQETETWKPYTGLEKGLHGYVWISNLGRVYKKGKNTSKNNSKILSCAKDSCGYMRMHCSIDGHVYTLSVHRLVAETFCDNPNPEEFNVVDHINAVRDDNRASNLRWTTQQGNCQNPLYLEKLAAAKKIQLAKHNWLKESLEKPIIAENEHGETLQFNSLTELKEHFHTKANLRRKLKSGDFFTSKKSKLIGWRLRYAS